MKTAKAIKVARTPEVERALNMMRRKYPTLDDPELFKLALSQSAYEPES